MGDRFGFIALTSVLFCACAADVEPSAPPDEVGTTSTPPGVGTGPGSESAATTFEGDLRTIPLAVSRPEPGAMLPADLYLETDRSVYDVERDASLSVLMHVGADGVSVPPGRVPRIQRDVGEGAWADHARADATVSFGTYGAGTFALLDAGIAGSLSVGRYRLSVEVEIAGAAGVLRTPPFDVVQRPALAGVWRGKLVQGDQPTDLWLALAEQRHAVSGKLDHASSAGQGQVALSGRYDHPDLILTFAQSGAGTATLRGTMDEAGGKIIGLVAGHEGHVVPFALVRVPE